VGLFRKQETYNEQMLREAGLDRVVFDEPETTRSDEPPAFPTGDISLGWLGNVEGGPMDWDAAVSVRAPGLAGDQVEFVTLPNGDVIVEKEKGDGDLSPMADAVEERVTPPYRAVAARQDGDLWGVGAKRIEVAQFEFPDADALELSENDGETELRVDGVPSDGAIPMELQRLGERVGANFCVEANRIDGDSWEVKVSAL
jgi:hypothetical protein